MYIGMIVLAITLVSQNEAGNVPLPRFTIRRTFLPLTPFPFAQLHTISWDPMKSDRMKKLLAETEKTPIQVNYTSLLSRRHFLRPFGLRAFNIRIPLYSARINPSVQSWPQGGGTGRERANKSVARHSRFQTDIPSSWSLAA